MVVERDDAHLRKQRLAARDHDHSRRARNVRQHRAGRLERRLDRPRPVEPPLDRRALFGRGLGHLHHPVDEQPQSEVGRHPPGAGVRRGEQPEHLELAQNRADRGGRQVDPALGQRLRPDGCPLSR